MILPIVVLAVLLLSNAGCGKKGPPVPSPLVGGAGQIIFQP